MVFQALEENYIIEKVISILKINSKTASRYKADIERLEDRKQYAEDDTFRLGVIGITSCGKSTLINSLLGEALLPVEARPTSSQLVSCRKGYKRCATVFFMNGKALLLNSKRLSSSIIKKYGSESLNRNNKENVKEIHIESTLFPFERNMVLIDSPGLDSYGLSAHEELTMHTLLPTVDLCIYIITCKDYSEQKLNEVFNTIAEYDKPVIVVQNMIDSVRSSPDGKKSRQVLLKEHEERLRNIIGLTKLADQPLIRIVQFSSIDALNGRIFNDKFKLKESRYVDLISAVQDVFDSLKPTLIGNRIALLKREIMRLIDEADQDASQGRFPIEKFQFDSIIDDFNSILYSFQSTIEHILCDIDDQLASIPFIIDDLDIENANSFVKSTVKRATNLLKSSNEKISSLADKLNISIRDLMVSTNVSVGYDIRLKKKLEYGTRTVDKPGWWNSIKRAIGVGGKKSERYSYSVPDVDANYKSIQLQINNCKKSITKVTDSWLEQSDNIHNRLEIEVKNRKDAYDARREQALTAKAYERIAQELKDLSNKIIVPKPIRRRSVDTHHNDIAFSSNKINVSSYSFNIYQLARMQINRIHEATIKSLLSRQNFSRENVIVGWDKASISSVASRFFNIVIETDNVTRTLCCLNRSKDAYAVYDPSNQSLLNHSVGSKNWFILIDPTQSGAALTQLNKVRWDEVFSSRDNIFFVIENFEKSINGNSVSEIIDIAKQVGKELSIKNHYMVLINHANPIYNMVALELQLTRHTLHYDETQIIKSIQSHFRSLYTRETYSIIKTIIHKLKQ